jgi:hypothetical protein
VHLVGRARFPAIDFHGHPRGLLGSAAGLDSLGRALDGLNVRLMVSADNLSGERLRQAVALVRASPTMRDRVRILAGVDFRNVGPGWAERAVAQLEADVRAGAVGVGEISKSFGLYITKADGTRLAFDYHNERWLEMALFARRRYPPDRFPTFAALIAERDRLFRKHPDVTFVLAHFGWQANDLAQLGALLDALPNVNTEMGAVLYDIGRQPRAARAFFLKYQDRILFGKDAFQPEEYPYYWRVLETADEYFDYYRPYHAFWKLYGIALPDSVLQKVYYRNALRITAGLPQEGWPR